MMETALDQLAKVEALAQRAAELRADLKRSLMLQQLWPEVFKYGKATTQVTGNAHHAMQFTIKNERGKVREFDLIAVPVELWPAAVIADIDAVHHFNTKYSRPLRIYRSQHKRQS